MFHLDGFKPSISDSTLFDCCPVMKKHLDSLRRRTFQDPKPKITHDKVTVSESGISPIRDKKARATLEEGNYVSFLTMTRIQQQSMQT